MLDEHRVRKYRSYLECNALRDIERIQRLVAEPSVSVDGTGVRGCASILEGYLRDLGCQEVELVGPDDYPLIWGKLDAGADRTIVCYANYDTSPIVDEAAWEYPPFSATVASHPKFDKVLYGRGARVYKGPLVAWLNSLEAILSVDASLPVNILFLLEGDEILGSPNYRKVFDRYRRALSAADASFTPGISQDAQGRVHVTLGYKGFIYLELRASGDAWGRGPKGKPSHGMAKAVVDSPTWRLLHAVASMTSEDGNTVNLDGFYEGIEQPSDAEWSEVDRLRSVFHDIPWQASLRGIGPNVSLPIDAWTEREIYANYLYGPSFNLNSLKSGYTGMGTKPVTLPHEALARLDIRLPRGGNADRTVQDIRDHLDARGYHDIELDVFGAFDPFQTRLESSLVQSVLDAVHEQGLETVVWPYTGAGGPWSLFALDLDIPCLRDIGVGFGGNIGAANEFLVLEGNGTVGGLRDCEMSHIQMLLAYAKQ